VLPDVIELKILLFPEVTCDNIPLLPDVIELNKFPLPDVIELKILLFPEVTCDNIPLLPDVIELNKFPLPDVIELNKFPLPDVIELNKFPLLDVIELKILLFPEVTCDNIPLLPDVTELNILFCPPKSDDACDLNACPSSVFVTAPTVVDVAVFIALVAVDCIVAGAFAGVHLENVFGTVSFQNAPVKASGVCPLIPSATHPMGVISETVEISFPINI
jgi:hypothetical protein